MSRLFLTILVLAAMFGAALDAASARDNRAGRFDYYVLSLSWSPSFCASPAGRDDAAQCSPGRRYAFVVHGLWPQYAQGWPESCRTSESWVSQKQIDAMMDLMPSKRLIIHEWRKHGTCSGLSQRQYFTAIRQVREGLRIPARYLSPTQEIRTTPAQLVRDLTLSNKALTSDMISVQCGNARDSARLAEVRICLDRQGQFTPCGRNEARQCQARELIMPEVR